MRHPAAHRELAPSLQEGLAVHTARHAVLQVLLQHARAIRAQPLLRHIQRLLLLLLVVLLRVVVLLLQLLLQAASVALAQGVLVAYGGRRSRHDGHGLLGRGHVWRQHVEGQLRRVWLLGLLLRRRQLQG